MQTWKNYIQEKNGNRIMETTMGTRDAVNREQWKFELLENGGDWYLNWTEMETENDGNLKQMTVWD